MNNRKLKLVITPRSFNLTPGLLPPNFDVTLNSTGKVLSKAQMTDLLHDVDAVIVGVDPLDGDVLRGAPNLQVIAKYGVGTDNIDLAAAQDRSIPVFTTPHANTQAVADYTMGLMLAVARGIAASDRGCRRGQWAKHTGVDVYGKTMGLLGLGQIGREVARRATGFHMRILAYDTQRDDRFARTYGIDYVSFERLLEESDMVSLHLPLTDATWHMLGRSEFERMKRTAIVINTARGGLMDEDALVDALASGRIWGAGIDVFESEPPDGRYEGFDNVVLGAHSAASSEGAVNRMSQMAAASIVNFFCGQGVAF